MRDMTENELKKHDFWFVGTKANPKTMVYETASDLLWKRSLEKKVYAFSQAENAIEEIKKSLHPIDFKWQIPLPREISFLLKNKSLFRQYLDSKESWITTNGCNAFKDGKIIINQSHWWSNLIVYSDFFKKEGTNLAIQFFKINNFLLRPILEETESATSSTTLSQEQAKIQAAEAIAFAEREKTRAADAERLLLETKAARDAELNKMLNQLMENTVGSLCQSYLQLLAENKAQHTTLQNVLKQKS